MGSFMMTSTAAPGSPEAEKRATEAAIDKMASERWFVDDWRLAQAAVMSQTIFEGFDTENLLGLMADVEYPNDEDRITFDEVRGLKMYFVSEGGQIDESRLTEQTWELPRDYIGFQLVELVSKLRSGFSRRSQDIVNLAIKQMLVAVNRRLWGVYQQAIPSTGSPYYASGNGVSLPQIDTAIMEVQDEAQTDNVTIIGRKVMLQQIINELRDQNVFAPETNEEMIRRGKLGTYNGATLVQLTNYKDSDDVSLIPGNELMVVAPDAAKVAFWGSTYTEEYNEQGGFYWHYMGRRTFGMALRKPEWVRRIVDTSRNP